MDNDEAEYVGDWLSYSDSEAYNGDFYYNAAGSGGDTATWTPLIPEAGSYRVYAWWSAGANRATDAPYTIHYNGGSETIDVDQQISGGQWNLLGTYNFAAGTSGSVTVATTSPSWTI